MVSGSIQTVFCVWLLWASNNEQREQNQKRRTNTSKLSKFIEFSMYASSLQDVVILSNAHNVTAAAAPTPHSHCFCWNWFDIFAQFIVDGKMGKYSWVVAVNVSDVSATQSIELKEWANKNSIFRPREFGLLAIRRLFINYTSSPFLWKSIAFDRIPSSLIDSQEMAKNAISETGSGTDALMHSLSIDLLPSIQSQFPIQYTSWWMLDDAHMCSIGYFQSANEHNGHVAHVHIKIPQMVRRWQIAICNETMRTQNPQMKSFWIEFIVIGTKTKWHTETKITFTAFVWRCWGWTGKAERV